MKVYLTIQTICLEQDWDEIYKPFKVYNEALLYVINTVIKDPRADFYDMEIIEEDLT